MPRRNRPRGPADDEEDLPLRVGPAFRVETRRGRRWNVQPVSGVQALKPYLCPGCGLTIAEGTAHVVVWRADGVLGETVDLEARRHWHPHCWRIA
ncbi:MAG: ATP/GTP-binding protein [Amnibacterium sp.]|nr:ATP/GTP-binding protein [Amnibacterium sp.]